MTYFSPKPLEYKKSDFPGFLSEKSFDYHYDKHYVGYIKKLNDLLDIHRQFLNCTLHQIISNSSGDVFNNAAQIFNHELFFSCISPHKTEMSDFVKESIESYFRRTEVFFQKFLNLATIFGSGWVWIIYDKKKIDVVATSNAIIPKKVLLLAVCDVWEHAYYIDYYNDRISYVKKFLEHLDWNKIEQLILNFNKKRS